MGMFDMLSTSKSGFFGDIFTTIMKKGLKTAFGGDKQPQPQQASYTPQYPGDMPISTDSATGTPAQIEMANMIAITRVWDDALFNNPNSYTKQIKTSDIA